MKNLSRIVLGVATFVTATLFAVILVAAPSAAQSISTCSVILGDRNGPEFTPGDFCDSVPGLQPIADDKDIPQDRYANQCDGDFDQNCVITMADFLVFAQSFLTVVVPTVNDHLDLNVDGSINAADFLIFAPMFNNTIPQ